MLYQRHELASPVLLACEPRRKDRRVMCSRVRMCSCGRELLSNSHRLLYEGSRIIPVLKTRSPKSLCVVSSTSSKSSKRFSKLCKSQWLYLGAVAAPSGHLSNPLTSGFWLTSSDLPIAFRIQLNLTLALWVSSRTNPAARRHWETRNN